MIHKTTSELMVVTSNDPSVMMLSVYREVVCFSDYGKWVTTSFSWDRGHHGYGKFLWFHAHQSSSPYSNVEVTYMHVKDRLDRR